MKLKTFAPADVAGKKTLLRVDFNVPFRDGKVQDDLRIRAHAPTIERLLGAGAHVALVSHFGRPDGHVVPEMSLGQLVGDVERVYGKKVHFVDDCVGDKVTDAMNSLPQGDLLLLENSRFHPEEQKNDPDFAKLMARPFEVFVMDAFSAAHRADVTTNGIMSVLPSFAGNLLVKEGEMLGIVCEKPHIPYVLIFGGAKVSDKIGVVKFLSDLANTVLIGGGMAYTFLKTDRRAIGKSLREEDRYVFARDIMDSARTAGAKVYLPLDSVVADGPNATTSSVSDDVPDDKMGLDIGPKTIELFTKSILSAKSILWNGPMGVFENPMFAEGTKALCEAVAKATSWGAISVIGGGDTASAVRKFGFADKVSWISTGGGATLEYCSGKPMPGMDPLRID
ncbi:MAG: phosphoglycerate kinase [Synergistaceae bacterium]|jgi:phosphoglycerate kinase|nr:phosphoglycerate kinase [Synergistaceae bacterium]